MKHFHTIGCNPDGSEILDQTKLSVNLRAHFKSADMKLKEMLMQELAKDRLPEETLLDDHDFELPDEKPTLSHLVTTQFKSKQEILRVIQKQQQKEKLAKQNKTDDEESIIRKSAKTDRAQRVEKHKNNIPADAVPTEGAEE